MLSGWPFWKIWKSLRVRFVTILPDSSITVACRNTSCTCFLKTNRLLSSALGDSEIDGLVGCWPLAGGCSGTSFCADGGGGAVRGGKSIGLSCACNEL